MTRFVVLRLYSMGLTLVGLSVLVFLMLRLIPGTVVEEMIGADAIVSPAMVAELTRFFGLDQPWWLQYGRWIAEIGHGNLGTSWRTGKPVLSLIVERLPVTLELTALSVAFALLLGIPAGIVSATRRDQAVDNVTRVGRSEEHTSELQSLAYLVCRLLLEKKKKNTRRGQTQL